MINEKEKPACHSCRFFLIQFAKNNHYQEQAFKIASLKVMGGRAIDGQIKSLIKTGSKGSVFIEQLGDAVKKRFNSMVDGWLLNEKKERDKGQQ